MAIPHSQIRPEQSAVLTRAVIRASGLLGLKDAELGQVIGVSGPTISRYKRAGSGIDPASKVGELALLFVRLFRSLDPLVGSDGEKRKIWMHTHNRALGGVPATLIRGPEGLVQALAYLDGLRASA